MQDYSVSRNKQRGIYQIWYREPLTGRRQARTLYVEEKGRRRKCKDKAEADKAARKFMAEHAAVLSLATEEEAVRRIVDRKREIAGKVVRVSELLSRYRSSPSCDKTVCEGRSRHIEMVMGKFVSFCDGKDVRTASEVDTALVSEFLDQSTAGKTAKTRNEYLAVLRQVFEAVFIDIGLSSNPASGVRKERCATVRRESLTIGQLRELLDGFRNGFANSGRTWRPVNSGEYLLVCYFGGMCGARLGDAVSMTGTNVDLVGRMVTYVPHKTAGSSGMAVSVPVVDDGFHEELSKAVAAHSDDLLTPVLQRQYIKDKAAVSSLLGRAIRLVCGYDPETEKDPSRERQASRYGFHSLRHTFVSLCAARGVPAEVTASIVGHSSTAMTSHYTHITDKDRRNAMAKVFEESGRDRLKRLIDQADDGRIEELERMLDATDHPHDA